MFTRKFWRDTAERAISTAAEAAVAILGADAFNIIDIDPLHVGGIAAGAALLAVLKAVGASARGNPESASLVGHSDQHGA